jgi:paraquat-inducible protein A
VACHECGTVHRVHSLLPGAGADCATCGATLYSRHRAGLDRILALYVTAAILFVLANAFPFMSLNIEGRIQETELFSSALALWHADMRILATVVMAFAIALPAVKIVAALWVLIPLKLGRRPWLAAKLIRLFDRLRPWAMMEVYLLGVMVAYVKLLDLAHIGLGPSMWAFVALILAMVAADAALDDQDLWDKVAPQATTALLPPPRGTILAGCHDCGQVALLRPDDHHARCARCGSALHKRKPDSLTRTWALVLTAAILYAPANIFPVMTVIYFGRGAPDTIISGVLELLHGGLWPLALLVFVASIMVPVLKLIGLSFLLLSVQRGSIRRLRDRTLLFRIIEQVGRWSMIDVFMIGILTALVNLGSIATIEPGIGAICFAGVVIVTMIASMSFDPRLMWDVRDDKLGRPAALRA